MSLINDMLRDLENRGGGRGGDALKGIRAAGVSGRRRPAVWKLGGVILLVAAVGGGYELYRQQAGHAQTAEPASRPAVAPKALAAVETPSSTNREPAPGGVQPVAVRANRQPAPEAKPASELRRVQLIRHDAGFELRLTLERAVHNELQVVDGGRRLTISLADAVMAAEMPDLVGRFDYVREVGVNNQPGGLGLVLGFARPVKAQAVLTDSGAAGAVLKVMIYPTPPQVASTSRPKPAGDVSPKTHAKPLSGDPALKEPSPAAANNPAADQAANEPSDTVVRKSSVDSEAKNAGPSVVHKSNMLSTADIAVARRYRRALEAIDEGRLREAGGLLENVLDSAPDNAQARITLARVYQRLGRNEDALGLLRKGLARHPDSVDLAEYYGRTLASLGKQESAIRVLRKAVPDAVGNGEYWALLAALEQQAGHDAQARVRYMALVKAHPDNAIWWVGLAISSERLGKRSDALAAYGRALRSGSLDPAVARYVDARVDALSNQ